MTVDLQSIQNIQAIVTMARQIVHNGVTCDRLPLRW